ncbi:MAG TPA: hypothetical protein VH414_01465 [Lichenihabitans sp.]|nr:hypothetical protein [Lichenihabitans sp.]
MRSAACIRAGVYVMMYNAIEAAVRAAMEALRRQIQQDAVTFASARDFWRLDCIQAAFLDKMQSGTNHGNVLTDLGAMSNSILQWHPDKLSRLPGSGNFGQTAALTLKNSMPLTWTAPVGTAGGVDLETIRVKRNDLSHGFEEYVAIGGGVTTGDMCALGDRTRRFMVSLLQAVEHYRAMKQYIR